MSTITIDEIQRNLKGYLQRVKAGETFLILDAEQPVAEIKPVTHNSEGLRPYALCAGEFGVPDDFDMPLPEEVIAQFESR
jgi:antitoxin (DNA-binding transcriptional repressor) of toxin-antitoxin stability system